LNPQALCVVRATGSRTKLIWRSLTLHPAIAADIETILLDPNYADAYYDKGRALDNLGKSREARQAYEKARQLGYTG
jgi:Flp pilus assembly protein TadD